jgi:hypothetical protein
MTHSAPRSHVGGRVLVGEEKRRSQRVMLKIPVTLKIMVAGKAVIAHAATVSVNDHGAMLMCTRSFAAETALELENERSNQKINCRVTRAPVENTDGYLIPVEFATSCPSFWGITFPPRDWKPSED